MSRQLGSLEDSYHTPLRRTNDLMTRSQFLTNSTVHSTNPEIVRHSFFKDQPVLNILFSFNDSASIVPNTDLSPITPPTNQFTKETM